MLCMAAHLWVSFCRLFLGTMLYQTDGDDVTRLCVWGARRGGGGGEARRRSLPFYLCDTESIACRRYQFRVSGAARSLKKSDMTLQPHASLSPAARLAAPPASGQECLFPQIRDRGVIIYLVFKTSASAI